MNQKIKITIIALGVLVVATLSVGAVLAQASTPTTGYGPGWMMDGNTQNGYGYGMMGDNTQNGYGYGMMGDNTQNGYGNGMMGGLTMNGSDWESMNYMHQWMNTSGGMHTFVWNTLAEKLELSNDELYEQVNNGRTIAQIAESKGITITDLVATLEMAHVDVLNQAVADGNLTQDQADNILAQMTGSYEWMIDNMGFGNMMGGQVGFGGCHGNWTGTTPDQQPKP
jgi:hypothetical protein